MLQYPDGAELISLFRLIFGTCKNATQCFRVFSQVELDDMRVYCSLIKLLCYPRTFSKKEF
jgi:hypothetical protein